MKKTWRQHASKSQLQKSIYFTLHTYTMKDLQELC